MIKKEIKNLKSEEANQDVWQEMQGNDKVDHAKVSDLANTLMTPCDNVSIQVTYLSGASFGMDYSEKGEGRRACREFFKNHTALTMSF